eukprot:scaffold625_cov324-Pavlova_lutheri.AAC.37
MANLVQVKALKRVARTQPPVGSSPIGNLQWMGDLRLGKVLNFPHPHCLTKLILTSKDEPPPKRLDVLQGTFLRVGGAQEQGIAFPKRVQFGQYVRPMG